MTNIDVDLRSSGWAEEDPPPSRPSAEPVDRQHPDGPALGGPPDPAAGVPGRPSVPADRRYLGFEVSSPTPPNGSAVRMNGPAPPGRAAPERASHHPDRPPPGAWNGAPQPAPPPASGPGPAAPRQQPQPAAEQRHSRPAAEYWQSGGAAEQAQARPRPTPTNWQSEPAAEQRPPRPAPENWQSRPAAEHRPSPPAARPVTPPSGPGAPAAPPGGRRMGRIPAVGRPITGPHGLPPPPRVPANGASPAPSPSPPAPSPSPPAAARQVPPTRPSAPIDGWQNPVRGDRRPGPPSPVGANPLGQAPGARSHPPVPLRDADGNPPTSGPGARGAQAGRVPAADGSAPGRAPAVGVHPSGQDHPRASGAPLSPVGRPLGRLPAISRPAAPPNVPPGSPGTAGRPPTSPTTAYPANGVPGHPGRAQPAGSPGAGAGPAATVTPDPRPGGRAPGPLPPAPEQQQRPAQRVARGWQSQAPLPHALTSTIDLSALQARLRMEHTAVIDRVREPVSRRGGAGRVDPESTQVVPRGLAGGAEREDTGRGRHRGATGPRGRVGGDGLAAGHREAVELDDVEADGGADDAPAQGGGTRSKALWTMADQAVSSATNAAISFLIAHQVTDVEYGAFGVSYTLFALVIGLSRGATCMPLSMFYSGTSKSQFRAAASAATGSSLVLGLAVGAVFVLAGLGIGGSVGSALLAMGAVLPGLLLQDAWRFVFFAMGRPLGALVNDLVWAGVQVVGIWMLVHRGVTEASPLVLAWGASALAAAFVGVVQAGFWPAPGATGRWLAENRTDAGYLAAEFLTVQGALQTSMLAIGAVGSLSTIGALQGARTLLGPTTVVGVGVVSFALPEFSKRTSMDRRARERAAWALSGVVLGVGAAWSLIFYLLPERYGHALLGDSWDGVKAILGLSILHYLAAGAPVGPACMIYALGKTKITFRINAAFAPVLLAFPVIGAVLGEARGAVIGFNIAFWALVPVWFILLRKLAREHDEEQAVLRSAAPGAASGARPAGRRPRRADSPASGELAWADDPAATGGWSVDPDVPQRGDRPSTKRWDPISSTKVRKADVPEGLRRDAPRTQHLRMERDANVSRPRVGDSERGIAGMDDGSGTARARPDRRDGYEQRGRATGPRHGRRGT